MTAVTIEPTTNDSATASPDALAKLPISALPEKTFEDGSRINDRQKVEALFVAFRNATANWRDNYREGKRLSRAVAIAMIALRNAVTDVNGDTLWAVKGLTAWKVVYADRLATLNDDLGLSPDEVSALATAVRGYIADRNLVVVGMAQRAIETTPLLADEDWIVDGQTWKVGKAVGILMGDDSKAAAIFEGKTMPAKLKAAIEVERKRQKITTGKKKGQQKQGFEKGWTYFGPTKATRAPATPNDADTNDSEAHSKGAKRHADALRDSVRNGNISMVAYLTFVRELLSEANPILVKAQTPKGGNVPGIVDLLDGMTREAILLADYRRPGDGQKPEKDAVVKAAFTIDA